MKSELDPSGPEGRGASASSASLETEGVMDEKGNTLTRTEKQISSASDVSGKDEDGKTGQSAAEEAAGGGGSLLPLIGRGGDAEADTENLHGGGVVGMDAEGERWARGVGEIDSGGGSVVGDGEDRARMRLESYEGAGGGLGIGGGGGGQLGDLATKDAAASVTEAAARSSVHGATTRGEEHHSTEVTMEKIIKDMQEVL